MFFISEIFESIQGEGNYAGARCLFIRFQHCNLSCKWCDTKFACGKNDKTETFSAEELKAIIRNSTSHNVIFTGGEPALYRLDLLIADGKKFHVETNGTIIPNQKLRCTLPNGSFFEREGMDENIIKHFNWVVSPKLSNSGEKINEESIRYFCIKNWGIFKFIIQNEEDISEVNNFVEKFGIDKKNSYLALEGVTQASQLRGALVDKIVENGYNFSPRLQVLLWKSKRKK